MSEDGPLTFATIDELWDELHRRHDSLLLVGERNRDAGNVSLLIKYKGSHPTAMGLAEYAKARLIDSVNRLDPDESE